MNLNKFYEDVLPSSGTYFVGTQTLGGGRYRQNHATSIQELVDKIKVLAKQRNVWFAPASFKNSDNRKATNAVERKSITLDIDAGPDKPYLNKDAAKDGLHHFLKLSALPLPTYIIDSGHGIHVWWAFPKSVPATQWKATALQLQTLCEVLEFHVDPTVTADTARILRAPETSNQKDKDESPIPVVMLYDKGPLTPFLDFTNKVAQAVGKHKKPVDNSDLIAWEEEDNKQYEPREYTAKKMLGECDILRKALDTGGAGLSERMWMHTLILLAFCADGDLFIHDISDQHAGYEAGKTERKFKAQQAKVHDPLKDFKPTLCVTLDKECPGICDTCSHHGKVKSPLHTSITAPDSILPVGWYMTDGGLFRQGRTKKEGKAVFVCHQEFTKAELLVSPAGTEVLAVTYMRADKPTTLTVTKEALADRTKFTGETSSIYMEPNERAEAQKLMASWARQLAAAGDTKRMVEHFGWTKVDGVDGFAVGEDVYWGDGTNTPARMRDKNMGLMYAPTGDAQPWLDMAELFTSQNNPAQDLVLAASFAAPLMSMVGDSGAVLSIVSPSSGTGKTTLLRLAQAVWGNPRTGINSLDDTANSIDAKTAMLNNLPVLWDEVRTSQDVESFVKMVFRLSQGKGKQRLNRGSTLMDPRAWDTLLLSASNVSLIDHMEGGVKDTDAGLMRVFEVTQPVIEDKLPIVTTLSNALTSNYGHAGAKYASWLACNKAKVQTLLGKVGAALDKELSPTSAERFWMSTATGCLAGAGFANALGLTKFDIPALRTFIVSTIEEMRRYTKEEGVFTRITPRSIVADFVSAHAAYISKSDYMLGSPQAPENWMDNGYSMADRSPLAAHMATKEHLLHIHQGRLDAWLREAYGGSVRHQKNILMNAGAVRRRVLLGKSGPEHQVPRVYVIEIPLNNANFRGTF